MEKLKQLTLSKLPPDALTLFWKQIELFVSYMYYIASASILRSTICQRPQTKNIRFLGALVANPEDGHTLVIEDCSS